MKGGKRKNKKREIRKKENECGRKRDKREWDRQFIKERKRNKIWKGERKNEIDKRERESYKD